MEDYKENLKTYIKEDIIYQEYLKNKNKNFSDFDKFCIQHCKDIEELLEENEKLKADYGNKVQIERDLLKEENKKYKEVIDDAIQFIKDTCIEQVPDMPKGCYREIASIGDLLDLLDILKEVEETDTNVGEVE